MTTSTMRGDAQASAALLDDPGVEVADDDLELARCRVPGERDRVVEPLPILGALG